MKASLLGEHHAATRIHNIYVRIGHAADLSHVVVPRHPWLKWEKQSSHFDSDRDPWNMKDFILPETNINPRFNPKRGETGSGSK
jgi:hypothetical protein